MELKMAIDFPNSPTINDIYQVGTSSWQYDGEKWLSLGVAGPAGVDGSWATTQTLRNEITTTITAISSDLGKLVTSLANTPVNVVIDSSLGLTTGQRIDFLQIGTGQVTFVASGVTLNATPGLKLRARYSAATLVCLTSNTYVLVGDLSA
jgi:hypothetical protein